MRHFPWPDVVFSSHKCSIIDRETRATIAVGIEDHGLYRLVDIGDSQEHAMAVKSSSISNL